MNQQARQDYLKTHIPYRMSLIDLLRISCEILSEQSHRYTEIRFDGKPSLCSLSEGSITNPFLEIGTLYCRVMLEFLGVELDHGKLVQRKRKCTDDVTIEDFGPPQISPIDAV